MDWLGASFLVRHSLLTGPVGIYGLLRRLNCPQLDRESKLNFYVPSLSVDRQIELADRQITAATLNDSA